MDCRVIVVLFHLGFGSTIGSSILHRVYHYVNIEKSWADAQSHCRQKYVDLATFRSMDDIQKLKRSSLATTRAWIGLRDDPKSWKEHLGNETNSWRWSATGKPSQTNFTNWASTQPNRNGDNQYCVSMTNNGKWFDLPCSLSKSTLCFDEIPSTGQRIYTVGPTEATWEEAQTYCRANHKDLAVIENAQEAQESVSLIQSSTWFGLYRQPWTWSDGSSSAFRNWNNGHPANVNNHYCAVETKNHLWQNTNCNEELVFICYEDVPGVHLQTVRMRMQSDADLSDPAVADYILQQFAARLKSNGRPELKLSWKKKPVKEDTGQLSTGDSTCEASPQY